MSGCRDVGISGFRAFGLSNNSGFRDVGMSGFRDFRISGFRDFGIPGCRDVGIWGIWGSWVSGGNYEIPQNPDRVGDTAAPAPSERHLLGAQGGRNLVCILSSVRRGVPFATGQVLRKSCVQRRVCNRALGWQD